MMTQMGLTSIWLQALIGLVLLLFINHNFNSKVFGDGRLLQPQKEEGISPLFFFLVVIWNFRIPISGGIK